jgi:pimeloyl-[acyl-carrier protein] methyl ester esterase
MATLVLLPGLHGTSALFASLQSVMPAGIRNLTFTYPTDRVTTRAALLQRLETRLQGEDDLVLIAESFSGPLAMAFSAANPQRVRALVLCVSFVSPPVPRVLCYLATVPVLLRCPLPGFAIHTFLSGFRASKEVVRELRREVKAVRPWVLAHRIRQAAWVDALDALAKCTMPVLCLAGKRDRLVGRRSVRGLLRVRSDVKVKWVDAPHLMLQVKPLEAWLEISRFLDACSIVLPARSASEVHN